ncbi:MAG: sel1 repeat family protein [Deltaproteobacteria bacterium]|jgi:TPR repeat protein|nr:sel1 repeat family protein [Deltaproteobacteria bacterium]
MSRHTHSENPEELFETGKRFFLSAGGNESDPELALRYFHKAAEMGHVPAQRLLGISLLEGNVCERDIAKAKFWLTSASDAKDPQAILYLAIIHAKGLGTMKRWDVAHDLLNRPEVEKLPEALELKRKLTDGLIKNQAALSDAMVLEEKVCRSRLTGSQAHFITPFWPYGGGRDDGKDFRVLLDLNLGKKTADEALAALKESMNDYYRTRVGEFLEKN